MNRARVPPAFWARLEAASEADATDALFLRGLTAFRLDAAGEAVMPWWRREVFASRRSLAQEVAALTRELATLIGAEIPVDQGLRIVSDQVSTSRMRGVAGRMLADVLNGAALSEAMQRQPGIFGSERSICGHLFASRHAVGSIHGRPLPPDAEAPRCGRR